MPHRLLEAVVNRDEDRIGRRECGTTILSPEDPADVFVVGEQVYHCPAPKWSAKPFRQAVESCLAAQQERWYVPLAIDLWRVMQNDAPVTCCTEPSNMSR